MARFDPVGRGAKLCPEELETFNMAAGAFFHTADCEPPELPAIYLEPCWYAAYTRANHEKKVAEHLCAKNVEHFLPLYETVHRWRDRRVYLQLPLLPGYVFIRLALCDRLRVLEVPSVARLVGFGELPAALPEEDIEILRKGLSGGLHAQPHPYLTIGRRVRIRNGPLAGMEGILKRRKGNFRVVLSLDLIMRSMVVEADASDLEPLADSLMPHGKRQSGLVGCATQEKIAPPH